VQRGISGFAPWGGLQAPFNKPNYAILQGGRTNKGKGTGTQISRTFTGLAPNKPTVLTVFAAERPGYGTTEMMAIFGNDKLLSEFSPADEFEPHTIKITPDVSGEFALTIENASPYGAGLGGSTNAAVFVSSVIVGNPFDCGSNATCHAPLPPRSKPLCRCDVDRGFVGVAVEGKKPTCSHSLDMMDLIKEVQGEVDDLEEGAAELLSATRGNKGALTRADAQSQSLRGSLAELGDNCTNLVAEAQDAVAKLRKDMEAGLAAANEEYSKLSAQVAALVGALQAVDGSKAATLQGVPDQAPQKNGFAPSVSAAGGDIDVVVQPGRRLTVNKDEVLTANDVAAAVAAALKAVGDAVDQ